MTHLSFYFKASFGRHPSMRDRAAIIGSQSCLCASLNRHVVPFTKRNITNEEPGPSHVTSVAHSYLFSFLCCKLHVATLKLFASSASCLCWHPLPRPGQTYLYILAGCVVNDRLWPTPRKTLVTKLQKPLQLLKASFVFISS